MRSTGFRDPRALSSALDRHTQALQHRALGFLYPVVAVETVSTCGFFLRARHRIDWGEVTLLP